MDFFIRKNSTLPLLVMEQKYTGQFNFDETNAWLKDARITFSMYNLENGVYKIANKPAEIYVREKVHQDENQFIYYIYYKFTKSDTNKVGSYKGEFTINYAPPLCDCITVPVRDDLFIHVRNTINKTTVVYS